jgi:hypothetical protein
MRTLTKADYIQAIRDNGFPQATGEYVIYKDGEIESACAVGQAMINLGYEELAKARRFGRFINLFPKPDYDNPFICNLCLEPARTITGVTSHLNDSHGYTLEQIADELEKIIPDVSREVYTMEEIRAGYYQSSN